MARLPARRRVPLPDLRRPRPRREPGRGRCRSAPASSGRRAGRVPGAARAARGDRRRRSPATRWAAIGAILAAAADPRVGGRRRDVRAGRPVPADPPDVPARPPADPRPDRLPARLAHDPGLPPAARPRRRATSAPTAAIARYDGPVLLAHGAEDAVVPVEPPGPARPRRPARRGPATRSPRRSRRSSSRAASTRWLYEDRRLPPGRRRRSSPARSAGRSSPTAAGELAAATPAERIPDGEAPFAAIEETPGGSGRSPRSRCPARPGRRRRRRRRRRASATIAGPASRDRRRRDPVWHAIRAKRAIRRFADRPLEPDAPRADPRRRPPRGQLKNLQRWAFIVCRDREHLRELVGGRAVGRPPRRRGRRRSPWSRPTRRAADAPLSVMFDLARRPRT